MSDPADPTLLSILNRCRHDHAAWINGDGSPYALPADGTILGAIGGYRAGGLDTLTLQKAVASQWTSGEGSVEFLNGSVVDDVAWLALVERAVVRLAGQSTPRRWDLRVTEVFMRRNDAWERVHRHADPLVDRHDLPTLLDLLE